MIPGLRDVVRLVGVAVAGDEKRLGHLTGQVDAYGHIGQRRNVQLHRIAHRQRTGGNDRRGGAVEVGRPIRTGLDSRAVASQRYFGDAAFDHLDTNPSISDVLRRDDRPAQVKTGRPIEIADRTGDRREVGLGDFLSEIRLIGPYQLRPWYRPAAGQDNVA